MLSRARDANLLALQAPTANDRSHDLLQLQITQTPVMFKWQIG